MPCETLAALMDKYTLATHRYNLAVNALSIGIGTTRRDEYERLKGMAENCRAHVAETLDAVEQHLERKAGTVLLAPAYTTPDVHIGYLSRYAPGMRENGGVYTHAATWSVRFSLRAPSRSHRPGLSRQARCWWATRPISSTLPLVMGSTARFEALSW